MTPQITKIKSVLNEISEARAMASEGMWVNVCADDHPLIYFEQYAGCYGIEIGDDGAVCYPEGRLSKKDSEFIVIAANKITALTRALEVAVDALENIEGRYEHPNDLHNINSARLRGCQLEAKSSISKIAEILEVKL